MCTVYTGTITMGNYIVRTERPQTGHRPLGSPDRSGVAFHPGRQNHASCKYTHKSTPQCSRTFTPLNFWPTAPRPSLGTGQKSVKNHFPVKRGNGYCLRSFYPRLTNLLARDAHNYHYQAMQLTIVLAKPRREFLPCHVVAPGSAGGFPTIGS